MTHEADCECCKNGYPAFLQRLENNIREYGHAVIATEGMAYTIGLSDSGLPELIVFRLPPASAQRLLNDAAKNLRAGNLPLDVPLTHLGNLPLAFKAVSPVVAAEYIIQANNRAGRELPALQMVWSDTQGHLPWEADFEHRFAEIQPCLYQKPH